MVINRTKTNVVELQLSLIIRMCQHTKKKTFRYQACKRHSMMYSSPHSLPSYRRRCSSNHTLPPYLVRQNKVGHFK